MFAKVVIIVLMLAVVASLLTSMTFLVRDDSSRRRTLNTLKVRVALSITLLAFIMLSWHMGWIQPHGLIPGQPLATH